MELTVIGIGAVSLTALVLGVTEFVKNMFSLEGKMVNLVAVIVGLVFFILYQSTVLYPQYADWINMIVGAVVFAMASGGYYDILTKDKTK